VIGRVNVWWDGRDMAPTLPKLFFIHFDGTSFVAEDSNGELLGFLCGFLSQTEDDEAYIHFVGVSPEERGGGLGRALYERFFDEAHSQGRNIVRCVTSPVNQRSVSRSSGRFRTTTARARIASCSSSG
jgi:ribosomal protein S18 acetylase RimI-like enzyme